MYVDGAKTVPDEYADGSVTDGDRLVTELRDRARYLERQVEEEREARRRADMPLTQLVERVAELEATQDAPESAAPRSKGFTPREHSEGTEKPAEPRSWWRRMFGG